MRDGKLCRIEAPDCAARQFLLAHGAEELRAAPPEFRVRTRHYSDDGTYGLYDAGRMSRHYDRVRSLGFDPVKDDAAMEPESCAFVVDTCRRIGARSALDLGTGQGNSCRSLIAGGVGEVVSVDDDARWTRLVEGLDVAAGGTRSVEFRTVGLIADGATYDLSCLALHHFDVVVVDGPPVSGAARLAAALSVSASHYLFHDSVRDRPFVQAFVAAVRDRNASVEVEWSDRGRGMARVSVAADGAGLRAAGRP